MQFTREHTEIQKTLKRFIDAEINPHVDEWEEAEMFSAHEVFKKMGNLGLLGLTKPEAYGGSGLDFSYSLALAETLGHIDCGGVPMGIGVSEPGAGSDVSAIKSVARQMFGATLADQQWVQFRLAEMKTDVECLRALTYRACELYVSGTDVLELASMAKLQAGRLGRLVPDGCLQFWGGMGYTWENKVARMFSDSRLGSIGRGAAEVMMGIIAKTMGVAKKSMRA